MPDQLDQTAPPPSTVAPAPAPDASRVMTLFVMIVATLYFGKEVLVPVTLALLLAFVLAPLATLLRRLHLGKVPSVLLGVILALGLILAIGGVIGSQIAELAGDIPKYAATVETKVANVRSYTVGRITHLADSIGSHKAHTAPTAAATATAGGGTAPATAAPAAAQAPAASSSPLELARTYLSPILSPLATLGIVFVVAVFALLQREDLRDRLIRLVGSDDLHRTTLAIDDGGRRLSRYFVTQLSINTCFGIVIGTGLLIIGVPNPVLWGILSGLLRFVPYVGSFLSAVLPMGLAAAVEPGWSMVLWTAGLYVVVEGVTGQVIEPMVYGHATGLSPFSVVVAAIFWSWVWGPVGLILSTPLTLCLVVMGRHVKRLEFLDVMLGDRPALTPVESFYQRILAGDADEAQDHAETLLRERSLSTYYDEVALKGMQLAANDSQRGVLGPAQLERIKTTIKTLVNGLRAHDDRQPARLPARPRHRRRARRRAGPGPAPRSGQPRPRRPRSAAGLARRPRGALHRRPRPARRGRLQHAGAAAGQARAGRPAGRRRRRRARDDRDARRRGGGDGLHLLPRHQRQPGAPALPDPAPPAASAARHADPGRAVADAGRDAQGPGRAAVDRRRLLHQLAVGGRDLLRPRRPRRRHGARTPTSGVAPGGWRTEWDSNPRYAFTHTRFPSVRLKPLGHLSGARTISKPHPEARPPLARPLAVLPPVRQRAHAADVASWHWRCFRDIVPMVPRLRLSVIQWPAHYRRHEATAATGVFLLDDR